jgi:prephenate dehydrogenase
MAMFERITVLGVGLIGASFALAMKKNGLCLHVCGFGRSKENLRKAKDRKIIDSFETNPADACRGADLIFFSTPVGSFLDLAKRCLPALKNGAIVTDAGSVKGSLVAEMKRSCPGGSTLSGDIPSPEATDQG